MTMNDTVHNINGSIININGILMTWNAANNIIIIHRAVSKYQYLPLSRKYLIIDDCFGSFTPC